MMSSGARGLVESGFGPQRAGDYLEPVRRTLASRFDSCASLTQLRKWQLEQVAAIIRDVDEACDSADTIPLSNALENRVLPWLQSLSELISLCMKRSGRFTARNQPRRFLSSGGWLVSRVLRDGLGENVLVFGGFLFHGGRFRLNKPGTSKSARRGD